MQKKDGTPARGGIPLTVEFTDPAVSTYLRPGSEAVSATLGKIFLGYEKERTLPSKRVIEEIWAILY